jgi:hypothetical protein
MESTSVRTFRLEELATSGIAGLDPLGADTACSGLPRLNAAKDVGGIAAALRRLLPSPAAMERFTEWDCAAATRDIGVFLGSLKRHGVEPVAAVPEVEVPLVALSVRTQMIPRDTVYHYGPWNPVGARQRMFTGEPEETILIDSVRAAAPALDDALRALSHAFDLSVEDPALACYLARAAHGLGTLIEALDSVRHSLPPAFFARTLRPYFEEVSIAGRAYLGPAAAQLPLYLVDELLWASDNTEDTYGSFRREIGVHGMPDHRALFARCRHRPSLITRIADALRRGPAVAPGGLRKAAEGVARLLRLLITFRGRHLTLARREYAEAIRLYPVGSGGASVELLEVVLQLTRQCAALVPSCSGHPRRGREASDRLLESCSPGENRGVA